MQRRALFLYLISIALKSQELLRRLRFYSNFLLPFSKPAQNSKVYLFKEQSHPGRVVVAHKKHVSEILELTPQERAAYLEEIAKVSEAIHKIFKPAKVNYGAYGDTGHHLHFHLVPKYTDEYEWGGTFEMNPGKKFLSDEEYAEMIEKIKSELV